MHVSRGEQHEVMSGLVSVKAKARGHEHSSN